MHCHSRLAVLGRPAPALGPAASGDEGPAWQEDLLLAVQGADIDEVMLSSWKLAEEDLSGDLTAYDAGVRVYHRVGIQGGREA